MNVNDLLQYAKSVLEEAKQIEISQETIDYSLDTAMSQIKNLSYKFAKIKNLISPAKKYLDYYEMYSEIQDDRNLKNELLFLLKNSYEDLNQAIQQNKSLEYLGDAIIEFKIGVGGEESAIFNMELWNMYKKYAAFKGWVWNEIDFHTTSHGLKEGRVKVLGEQSYLVLRHEAGVHRVQRIPKTESMGRVHTSAAALCVFKVEQDIDIEIKQSDLEITSKKSSGPGGQSVNTTDSAITIKHIPSGLVVNQQDERSQIKNKEKALKILKERLFIIEQKNQAEKRSKISREQFARGDRSDKIRTYNFSQQRVTDHLRNITVYQLDQIMKGEEEFDRFISKIIANDKSKNLDSEL